MIPDDLERTEVRRPFSRDDAAQRAKVIFLSLAAAVAVLLIASFVYAAKARSERNALRQEVAQLRQDNANLTQWLEERTQEVEQLRKRLQGGQAKPKAKAPSKPAPKKKSSTTKKTSQKSQTRR
jgi:uncharacterized protein YlxW (UPF0749 family)